MNSDIFDDIPDRFTVARQSVSSEIIQEYLVYTESLDFDQYSEEDILSRKKNLFALSTTLVEKKETLAILSYGGTVEAYRTIEKFLETAEPELKDWGVLALQECQTALDSSLLDRSIGMLMTGLGGEGNKLRYFVLIRTKSDAVFTPSEKDAIERSFLYICSRFDSILEDIQVHGDYATLKVLIPLDVAVAEVIEGGIEESNTFGDFLAPCHYCTNTEIPEEAEVLAYLRGIERNV